MDREIYNGQFRRAQKYIPQQIKTGEIGCDFGLLPNANPSGDMYVDIKK